MKRVRSLVVLVTILSMLLGLSGLTFAQFSDVDEDADYAPAVNFLLDLDITEGYPDGTFRPEGLLTRQEFAAFVVRAMGREAVAQAFANYTTPFTDDNQIGPWARGYMVLATQLNILRGYPDGSVKPQGNVTQAEALTMLVRALGPKFIEWAEEFGTWPGNYLNAASELGLDEGVDIVCNVPMTRAEMAIVLKNATLASFDIDRDGELVEIEDGSKSWYRSRHNKSEDDWRKASEVEKTVRGEYERVTSGGDIRVDGTNYAVEDYEDLKVELNEEEQDEEWTASKLRSFLDGIDDDLAYVELSLNRDGKVIKVHAVVDTYRNGLLNRVTVDRNETEFGTIRVGTTNIKVDDDTEVLLDGKAVSLADLKEAFDEFQDEWDDKPAVATVRTRGDDKGNNATAIYVSVITDDTVSGKIESRGTDSGGAYVRIDGTKVYHKLDSVPEVGKTYTLLLGHDGKAYVILADDEITDDEFYAKLLNIEEGNDEVTVTVELANGDQKSVTAENIVYEPNVDEIQAAADDELVVRVEIDAANDEITLAVVKPAEQNAYFSRTTAARVYYFLTENDLNNNENEQEAIRYADGVFVYDEEDEDYISLSSLRKGDVIDVYLDGTDVYLIVLKAQEDDGAPAPGPGGSFSNPVISASESDEEVTIDFGEAVRVLDEDLFFVEDANGNVLGNAAEGFYAGGVVTIDLTGTGIQKDDDLTVTIWIGAVEDGKGNTNATIVRTIKVGD